VGGVNDPENRSEDELAGDTEGHLSHHDQHPSDPPYPVIGEPPVPAEVATSEDPAPDALDHDRHEVPVPPPSGWQIGSAVPSHDAARPGNWQSPPRWQEEEDPSRPLEGPPADSPGEWDSWTAPDTFRADDGLGRYPAPPPLDESDNGYWIGDDETDADARSGARSSRQRSVVRELVETGLMALLVFLAVRATFQNYRVHGHSMDPTLQDGEFLLVNRIEYAQINIDKLSNFIPFLSPGNDAKRDVFTSPSRGDIIILEDPRQPQGDRLVKRVIGLPGDKLEIVNGTVYINGRLLHEPYIPIPGDYTSPPIVIPQDQYFVMGDNRKNSEDSRYLGLIPRDLIIGKAMIAMWPSNKFGFAPNESPTLDPAVTR
jgi:signal peptidase I